MTAVLDALKHAAGDAWRAYVQHEFVLQLGAGALDPACFRYYLRQDYVFLRHYARATSLGVAKADHIDLMRHLAASWTHC